MSIYKEMPVTITAHEKGYTVKAKSKSIYREEVFCFQTLKEALAFVELYFNEPKEAADGKA